MFYRYLIAIFLILPLILTTQKSILAAETETLTKPKFIIPEFQIKISNLNLTAPDNNGISWIAQYISFMYNYGFNIAIAVASLVVIVGGALWLISSGNQGQITKAKEIILGGLFGLILIAVAYVLLAQVNPDLVNLKKIDPVIIEEKRIKNK